MYVKITNGAVDQYPYTIGQLRRDNPNTSFPKTIPESVLNSFGVYSVTSEVTPVFNHKTQYIQTSSQPVLVSGVWKLTKTVQTKTQEQITSDDNAQAEIVRKKRDILLAETDWTGMSDVTMTAAMTTYRQALRDITAHADFPYLDDDDWPTKP